MKTSAILLISALFFYFFFTSTKGALESTLIATSSKAAVHNSSLSGSLFAVSNKKKHRRVSPDFKYKVIKTDCGGTGATYTVEIVKPGKYAFLWEANGLHAGHGISTYCLCGDYVKVRVMRLSDGLQKYTSLRLQNCLVRNAPNAAEE